MKIYFVGIKGTGMSALSLIYLKLGFKVSGSDVKDYFFTQQILDKYKIKYYEGFDPQHIVKEKPDIVISSVAWQQSSEVLKAKELKIKVLTYPQGVAQIFNKCFGIAICGTHGKSTTTAFIGKIFQLAKLPSIVLVGSPVKDWQAPFYFYLDKINKINSKIYFILEADEYREAFLSYRPKIIVVTNIDYDHPDYFKNKKQYKESFKKFFYQLQPPAILISHQRFHLPQKIRQIKISPLNFKFNFYAPGNHWQKNLNLVFHLANILNLNEYFWRAIKEFKGVYRRFDIINENPILIDDYGHHPQEILAFYKSLQQKFPQKNFYFVFQPHTYSRTKKLFKEFKKVFKKIKNLIIFKTFSSAREKEDNLTEEKLKKLVHQLKALYFDDREKLKKFLLTKVKKGYGIATCGAGNVYEILNEIKKSIAK